ncbi:MAG: HAMP domain-containing sensor histidine kinase [Methylacidiphilales bacterium]|nr:HAMP domain-containing sensor histidine kinase [Candidatus Methylacidiphilales bacterium]
MKKTAAIFLLAIFLPALVLGVLAVRTAGQQRILLEQQETELRQKEVDLVAQQITLAISREQQSFVDLTNRMLAESAKGTMQQGGTSADVLARDFTEELRKNWKRPALGFAVTTGGAILSPSSMQSKQRDAESARFLRDNSAFLGNEITAQVYQAQNFAANELVDSSSRYQAEDRKKQYSSDSLAALDKVQTTAAKVTQDLQRALNKNSISSTPEQNGESPATAQQPALAPAPQAPPDSTTATAAQSQGGASFKSDTAANKPEEESKSRRENQAAASLMSEAAGKLEVNDKNQSLAANQNGADAMLKQADQSAVFNSRLRSVMPQKLKAAEPMSNPVSQLNVATSRFAQIVRQDYQGILARYVQDELEIFFWMRPASHPDLVFAARLKPEDLKDLIRTGMGEPESSKQPAFCLAILDDHARPILQSVPGFKTRWKSPFVAAEVGEVLPHWEAAIYPVDAQRLSRSATLVSRSLMALSAFSLGAIAFGAYLIWADTRRQLALAQKKTDFVSNVSHELKTPLTSIRMFAELLQQGRVLDSEKTAHYLQIITLEAERLSRLINNVLDFARMDRNQKRYSRKSLDLYPVIQRVWESHELHLQNLGFNTVWHAAPPPYPVYGDEDALAQVLVNLLSNAEKYSPERKEIELHTSISNERLEASVLDRGLGVPKGEEQKIFEHFYRAHDSLSSGIQGSGLGLTLAKRIAEDHGGTITYQARNGGGSIFTFALPLEKSQEHPLV